MKRESILGITATLLVLGLAGPGRAQDAAKRESAITVQVAKYADLMKAVQAQRGKVVLVDFWAMYCLPCRAAFPHVVELHKKYGKQGLVVISVSLDELKEGDKTKERALAFLTKQQATFQNLILNEPYQVWQEKLRFMGPPCYFVFSKRGEWIQFNTDEGRDLDHQEIERTLVRMLKE